MVEDTVHLDGEELNAEDVHEAAQNVAEEPKEEGSSIVGNVFVYDDGWDDNGVNVCVDGNNSRLENIDVYDLIEMAEKAIEEPFEEYVDSLSVACEIVTDGAGEWGSGYDALICCNRGFSTREIQSLIEDSGVKLGKFAERGDTPTIGLNDVRDE